MLEKWLETLEKEKQEAITRVRKSTNNQEIIELALEEIEINSISVKRYLQVMFKNRYRLTKDLSKVEEDYNNPDNLEYRGLCNGLKHHFHEVETIPKRVEKGEFKPFLAKEY